MLLAIDIGNTNTGFGVFEGTTLRADWRCETRPGRTEDEYVMLLGALFARAGLDLGQVTAGIISSVVPLATAPVERFFSRTLRLVPHVVGPDSRTGLEVLYENPRDLGADRLVNAVAAHARFPQGAVVVDFGTATKLDVVTDRGQYAGGIIAPGLSMSAEALVGKTARLPRVELRPPARAIGRTTVGSLQSGLVLGYSDLVEGLVGRIRAEVSFSPRVIATGGLASCIAALCRSIEEVDERLTLQGLRILHEHNRS